MSRPQPRFSFDQIEELPKDLLELGDLIGALPLELRHRIEPSYARVVESTRRRRRILRRWRRAVRRMARWCLPAWLAMPKPAASMS